MVYPAPCVQAESLIPEVKKLEQQSAELYEEWQSRLSKDPSVNPHSALHDRVPAAEAEYARRRRDLYVLQEQCAALLSLHPPSVDSQNNARSGEWRVQDGMLVCDGYVVRNIDKNHCADQVPDDWVPRMYDGEVYYVQPLGSGGGA